MCLLEELAPLPAVEQPALGLRADAAPLLGEERDTLPLALIADVAHPVPTVRKRVGRFPRRL